MKLIKGDDIMESVNKELQDYFIKIAPDFSLFDMTEKYYYDHNNSFGDLDSIFLYVTPAITTPLTPKIYQTNFYRGSFLIFSTGEISIEGAADDEYTVFPYYPNTQILIGIQETAIKIVSTENISLIIGMVF